MKNPIVTIAAACAAFAIPGIKPNPVNGNIELTEKENDHLLMKDVIVQHSRIQNAEAKRYRKKQKALRDAARTAAGMVC